MSNCAAIVAKTANPKVIVVSAIGDTTRILVSLAQQIPMSKKEKLLAELKTKHYQITDELKNKPNLDKLLNKVKELAEKLSKNKDAKLTAELLALGEQMASLLFTAVLNDAEILATDFDVKKIMKTNMDFVRAEPDISQIKQCCAQYLLPLCKDQAVVTQGFIGADTENNTTILGMESSDYTA
ncbi:unnamed protein product, partial [marine sediment metagenome]